MVFSRKIQAAVDLDSILSEYTAPFRETRVVKLVKRLADVSVEEDTFGNLWLNVPSDDPTIVYGGWLGGRPGDIVGQAVTVFSPTETVEGKITQLDTKGGNRVTIRSIRGRRDGILEQG